MPAKTGGDWRQLVKDTVAQRADEARERSRGTSATNRISRVGFAVRAHFFLVQAAKKRGISISGYIRRATMTQVALDLDIPQLDLFETDAAITPIGKTGTLPSKDLDGALYGRWGVAHDVSDAGPEPDRASAEDRPAS